MRTNEWRTKSAGSGKYHVQIRAIGDKAWQNIPGMILGGRGRWAVQIGGNQWPNTFKTLNKAASAMVSDYFGI